MVNDDGSDTISFYCPHSMLQCWIRKSKFHTNINYAFCKQKKNKARAFEDLFKVSSKIFFGEIDASNPILFGLIFNISNIKFGKKKIIRFVTFIFCHINVAPYVSGTQNLNRTKTVKQIFIFQSIFLSVSFITIASLFIKVSRLCKVKKGPVQRMLNVD